jgi:hypothetical protein
VLMLIDRIESVVIFVHWPAPLLVSIVARLPQAQSAKTELEIQWFILLPFY